MEDEKKEAVRQAIIRAVPYSKGVCTSHDYHHEGCFACKLSKRMVQLADVLAAIRLTKWEINFDFDRNPKIFGIMCDYV